MAEALATLNKSELAQRVNRMRSTLANAREQTRTATRRATGLAMAAAGGFTAGIIDSKAPEIGGVPTNLALGLTLGAIGAVDGAGDQSDMLVALGGGMLAAAAYDQGKKVGDDIKF